MIDSQSFSPPAVGENAHHFTGLGSGEQPAPGTGVGDAATVEIMNGSRTQPGTISPSLLSYG